MPGPDPLDFAARRRQARLRPPSSDRPHLTGAKLSRVILTAITHRRLDIPPLDDPDTEE